MSCLIGQILHGTASLNTKHVERAPVKVLPPAESHLGLLVPVEPSVANEENKLHEASASDGK